MNIVKTSLKKNISKKAISRGALSLAVTAGLSLAAGTAFAQDPTSMAPPVQSSAPAGLGAGTNAAADSVFNWQEIPANQQVPLARATFDQGGYQLYDSVGETIVVPFTNDNLYVMKFATSQNGSLYFENQGGYPVLYVPKGGFLENATVAGARWYPFGQSFHPAEPVFLGIAPSYPEFVDLGWYPNTFFYGGYYGGTSFLEGGVFLPTVGLFFSIGGHPYYGWNAYHNYYFAHPGFSQVGYYNRGFYHYAGSNYRTFAPGRRFGGFGGGGYAFNHGGGFNRGGFGGNSGAARFGGSGLNGRTFRGTSNFGNGSHNYTTTNRSVTVNNFGGGGQRFGGSQSGSSARTFRGASNYGGGQSYGGGSRSGSQGGSSRFGGSASSFGGGQGSHSSGGSSRSFGGGQSSHSFGGGQARSSGGGQSAHVSGGGGNRGGGGGGNRR